MSVWLNKLRERYRSLVIQQEGGGAFDNTNNILISVGIAIICVFGCILLLTFTVPSTYTQQSYHTEFLIARGVFGFIVVIGFVIAIIGVAVKFENFVTYSSKKNN